MDDKDGHGFETWKAGSTLSTFYAMPVKITEEIIMVSSAWWNLFVLFFITLQEQCMGKGTVEFT